MTRLAVLAALLILIASSRLAASDTIPAEIIDLPRGVTVGKQTVKDLNFAQSVEYKCFSVAEYEVVAHIIVDYRWLFSYAMKMQSIDEKRQLQIEYLGQQVDAWKTIAERYQSSHEYISGVLVNQAGTNDVAIHSAVRSYKIGLLVSIGIAVIEAGVISAVAIKR